MATGTESVSVVKLLLIAGLVGCLVIGPRLGYNSEPMPPHNLVMTMIGASLLWIGWFGFNAGSALESNAFAALAFINTFVATAAAGAAWAIIEQITHKKPSLLGAVSGVVAGLVAITPAAGFAHPGTAIILGAVASVVCYFFVTTVKNKIGYDDSLDVFGIHAVGGIVGAIGTGIVADPALGGQGWIDYTGPVAKALPLPATVDPITLDLNYAGTTQYAGQTTTTVNDADGNSSGAFLSVSIDEDGAVLAQYSNGLRQRVGTVALAIVGVERGFIAPADRHQVLGAQMNAWSEYLSTPALVWHANLNSLELHTPQWKVDADGAPQPPDRLVIDLDRCTGCGACLPAKK